VIIPERQAELNSFYRDYLADEPQAESDRTRDRQSEYLPTDDEVIQKLLNENTGKGRALFGGDTSGYKSASEADQAFFNKVYFYTQDFEQISRVYRRSGLNREKGDRPDYLRRTYMKAANTIRDTYEWRNSTNLHAEEPHNDVLTRLPAEVCQRLFRLPGNGGDVRMVLLTQRPREDDRPYPRLRATPRPGHTLERPASQEEGVELVEQVMEVDVGVHDDPVRFAVGPRDESVQAHRNHVANPSHRSLP
jgi:hypothetical protein